MAQLPGHCRAQLEVLQNQWAVSFRRPVASVRSVRQRTPLAGIERVPFPPRAIVKGTPSQQTMHKAILFDLGRVLIHFDFVRAYESMAPLCGFPAGEIPARLAPSKLVERFETGLIEPEPFFEQLTGLLELRMEYTAFCEVFSS